MNPLKEHLGEVAHGKLRELLIRESNLLKLADDIDFKTHKQAIKLFLSWVGSIYDLDKKSIDIDPDADIDNLFPFKYR